MKAYTGIITKEEFIKEIKWHKEQDNFIQGHWFEDGKGCAVGCSLESIARTKGIKLNYSDFSKYPELLGIPEWAARLEEKIFEGLGEEDAKQWVLDFSEVIEVGQDLKEVENLIKIFIQEENIKRVELLDHLDKDIKKQVIDAINLVISYLKGGSAAESAAYSAARSAWSAESAAWSAESARSAESAAWSAESAAWSAESAAESARSAAESAAYSAARSAWSARSAESAAWSARSAESAAESAEYKKIATKFLQLIKEGR